MMNYKMEEHTKITLICGIAILFFYCIDKFLWVSTNSLKYFIIHRNHIKVSWRGSLPQWTCPISSLHVSTLMAEHFPNEDIGDESLTFCRAAISTSTSLNCFHCVQMAEQKSRADKQSAEDQENRTKESINKGRVHRKWEMTNDQV